MFIFLLAQLYAMFPYEEVSCPIGDDHARIFSLISQNQMGGYDSDLASYSKGEQFRTFAISTCYENFFSLYGKDFTIELTDDQKKKIEGVLKQSKKRLLDPKNPLLWERYEIAADIYKSLEYNNGFLAQLYLEASWTVRDSFVGFHQGLEGPKAVEEVLNHGFSEIASQTDPDKKKLLIFNLARVAHRGGNETLRNQYLDMFTSLSNLTDRDKNSISYVQDYALKKERYYQEKALFFFASALKTDDLNPKEKNRILYLTADLHRRLGNHAEAIKRYKKVQVTGNDSRLHELSLFFIQKE